jgi:ABC-2 type transport system ATP-binding protein
MIEIDSLTKRYGDTVAVRDLSFSARPGSILGFLGPNGAGKTTTLRAISQLATSPERRKAALGGW